MSNENLADAQEYKVTEVHSNDEEKSRLSVKDPLRNSSSDCTFYSSGMGLATIKILLVIMKISGAKNHPRIMISGPRNHHYWTISEARNHLILKISGPRMTISEARNLYYVISHH